MKEAQSGCLASLQEKTATPTDVLRLLAAVGQRSAPDFTANFTSERLLSYVDFKLELCVHARGLSVWEFPNM